jgi:ABC-2 type transport system permease protein
LTSTDRLYGLGLAAVLSWRDFRAVYPPRIYLLTTLPRVILQVAFFALVGELAAGEAGREFALIGASAHVMVLATVVRAPDVLVDERTMGTLHRVRLGVLPLPAIAAARWLVYTAAGFVDALVGLVVVGLAFGETGLVVDVLAAAPLLALMALTTSALGVAIAAASLTKRVDFVLANLASYLTLVFCGAVAPLTAFPEPLATMARGLPLTNGLLAIRAVVAGEPWLAYAGIELAVGAIWAAFAVTLMHVQARRGRALGTDERL